MSTTCVHLTRIRPGQVEKVQQRLDAYQPDAEHLRRLGVRRLEFFTSGELGDDCAVVVAVIEGRDDRAIMEFLEENERSGVAEIHALYVPHGHEVVLQATRRCGFVDGDF